MNKTQRNDSSVHTFNSTTELAKWINNNISSLTKQEQLMHEGISCNRLCGSYTICVYDIQEVLTKISPLIKRLPDVEGCTKYL